MTANDTYLAVFLGSKTSSTHEGVDGASRSRTARK